MCTVQRAYAVIYKKALYANTLCFLFLAVIQSRCCIYFNVLKLALSVYKII